MVNVRFWQKKREDRGNQLSDAGINCIKDSNLAILQDDVEAQLELEENEENSLSRTMNISEAKKDVLTLLQRKRRIALRAGISFGSSKDNPRYYKSAIAWRRILIFVRNLLFSSTEDEDTILLANDLLGRADLIIQKAIGEIHTTPQRAYVVQTLKQPDRRYGEEKEQY